MRSASSARSRAWCHGSGGAAGRAGGGVGMPSRAPARRIDQRRNRVPTPASRSRAVVILAPFAGADDRPVFVSPCGRAGDRRAAATIAIVASHADRDAMAAPKPFLLHASDRVDDKRVISVSPRDREAQRRRGMARVSARHRLDIRRARSGDRLTCGVSRCPAPDEATLLPGTHPLRASAPPREPRPGCLSLDVDEPREDAKRKGSRGGAEAQRGCSGGSGLPGQDRREAGGALARERRRGFA